jgi:hypothetical protein
MTQESPVDATRLDELVGAAHAARQRARWVLSELTPAMPAERWR